LKKVGFAQAKPEYLVLFITKTLSKVVSDRGLVLW